MDTLKYDPLNGLHQTSLNIQSLLEDGSKDIAANYTEVDDEDLRDERVFSLMLDVVQELPIAPDENTLQVVRDIYQEQPVVRTFIDIGSTLLLNEVLLPRYGLPRVLEYESQRVDDAMDVYWLAAGIKDGVVGVTEDGSKLALCNGNVSNSIQVYKYNWETYSNDWSDSLSNEKWNQTAKKLSEYTGDALRWPFFTVYNCYWASNDLIKRYDNLLVPLLFQEQRDDGTYEKVGFWSNVLFNLAFNAGYQFRDVQWFWFLSNTEGNTEEDPAGAVKEYWYRSGYVLGDIYMRAFYRTTVDAPEKLKSQQQ